MSSPKPKAFNWRMSEIPSEYTKEQIVDFFVAEDRDRVKVESLFPDVEAKHLNVATILFEPQGDRTKEAPQLGTGHLKNVKIDKHFKDFTPLYQPLDGTIITADIIAVTGLAGHAFGSWANAENEMWLRDYLPSIAPSARIMTYGYSSPISGGKTSCNTIEDLSERFFSDLIYIRELGKCEQRPIIFIGHSLGGLIIKHAMASAWSKNVDRSRLPVRSIIFLGVPHNGMDTDALRSLVGDSPPEALIRELAPGSLTLRHLNKEFKKIAMDVSICTLWESLSTQTVALDPSTNQWSRSGPEIMMVPEHSARLDLPRERVISADADHSTIAKVKRSEKTTWRILSSTIQAWLATTRDTVTDKPQEQQFPGSGNFGVPGAGSDWTASSSPVPWISGSTVIGSHSPPVTHPGQQSNSPPTGSHGHPSTFPPLPLRSAVPTTATGTGYMSADSIPQRSTTPQPPPPSNTMQPPYSYDSTSIGEVSPPVTNGIASGTDGITTPALSTIDSSLTDQPGDAVQEIQKPTSCICNSTVPGEGKIKAHCTKCSAVIYPLDYGWACEDCKTDMGFCSDCHARGLADATCEKHKGKKISRKILVVLGMQLWFANEKTLSTEEWFPNQAVKRTSLLTIKKWFGSIGQPGDLVVADKLTTDPFHIAAQQHMPDEMDMLLKSKGAQSNLQDSVGQTPLMTAVVNARACIVQKLLAHGADVDSIVDRGGNTALYFASYWGFESIVAILMNEYSKRGLKTINKFNHLGSTVLLPACKEQHWEIAKSLLRAGADPLAEAPKGHATKKSRGNQIGKLANFGNTEAVQFLLTTCQGLGVECWDNSGRTLLSQAAAGGHGLLCEMLLKMGADPDVRPTDPPFPILHYAAGSGHKDVVQALLNDKRTKIDATDSSGGTALLLAAIANHLEIVKILLEKGANAEPKPARPTIPSAKSGKVPTWKITPLFIAAIEGYSDMCRILLDHGADASVQLPTKGSNGVERIVTPLFSAVIRGDLPICKMLIEAGADKDLMLNTATDDDWQRLNRPLHLAAGNGYKHIVSYLIRQGAVATPPPRCRGKWKNFEFAERVGEATRNQILELLRAHKHQ